MLTGIAAAAAADELAMVEEMAAGVGTGVDAVAGTGRDMGDGGGCMLLVVTATPAADEDCWTAGTEGTCCSCCCSWRRRNVVEAVAAASTARAVYTKGVYVALQRTCLIPPPRALTPFN